VPAGAVDGRRGRHHSIARGQNGRPGGFGALARTPAPGPALPVFRNAPFDSVPKVTYLLRHSCSLDNYLEFEPGFFLGRFGPIGKRTIQSRYAFGRGRCAVYLNSTLVNDPQNDIAPLPHFPVSGLGVLLEDGAAAGMLMGEDGIEGRIRAVEASPAPDQPTTFLELSRSTQQNLRQRRVWFSSMRGKIGLDFGYDEILNDGYSFDARQLFSPVFIDTTGYGRSRSRYVTVNLRGEMPNGDRYTFSLRRYQAVSDGDLRSASAEEGLGGLLAAIEARLGRVRLNVFTRGYDASRRSSPETPADSNTVNLTAAAFADVRVVGSEKSSVTLGGGHENIDWIQNVGGASDQGQLRKWTARATAVSDLGGGVTIRAHLSGVTHAGMRSGWGGAIAAERPFGRHELSVYARRGFRMPNLGELFLPPHAAAGGAGVTLAGNRYLDSEYAWEAGGRVTSRLGPVTNELRALTLRVHRPIAFAYTTVGAERWLVAQNGESEAATVVEDRVRLESLVHGFELRIAGGGSLAEGDRESFFRAMPKWNAHASFRFGRSIFQATSALYIGCDYTFRSKRSTVYGGELPSYHVLNVKLDGRLLNANMYLMMMNVLDEQYQTIEGYLMTPRTFVFGLWWKLFN
jgi:hypothetical protein